MFKLSKLRRCAVLLFLLTCTVGCSWFTEREPQSLPGGWRIEHDAASVRQPDEESGSNVYYEIFVRAFADSDGDGIGDLRGVVNMLDYLNDGDPETAGDLGIDGIWLMPIHPSPSYHGYDVTDYYRIHPDYGTMEDFRLLISEANNRGIEVIIDLVVNHTSSEHPWFRSAALDRASEYRDWYIWRDDPGEGLSLSATGGQAWHSSPGGGADYLGVFWGGMPDLNLRNKQVREEMTAIGKYWLEQGVAGFRLDAAKHIFEDLSGDEKKPELAKLNIEWWEEFRDGLEEVNPAVYLIGEVWESSPARVAPYLQVFDSAFNFAAGELAVSAASREEDTNLAFSLERMQRAYAQSSGGRFVDAPFLTNHDQNRVMSSLRGDVDQAKMAASILLTLPGRPYIYYGEEIGMQGVKPDEEIREPMKWADEAEVEAGYAAEYASSMTSWRVPRHQAHTPSVYTQDADPTSLLNHYRALIHLRSKLPVLTEGVISQVDLESSQVMAYERRTETDRVLVVHNLGSTEIETRLARDLQGTAYERIIAASKQAVRLNASSGRTTLTLPPYSTAILR